MATYTWTAGNSGDWNTATAWADGVVPNTGLTADVVIDALPVPPPPPATPTAYTVTIGAGESISVNSIQLNAVNNAPNLNGDTYLGAVLEVDGTLNFAAGSAGEIGGPLQNEMVVDNGIVQNAGTINAFVQAEGIVSFTGTNGIYFTNWLQSLGAVTIDTSSIAEYTVATNTLFDGIFEARGSGNFINLGGNSGGLIVNMETVQGPGTDIPDTDTPGYTQLIFDGPESDINEWNGSAYVSVESSIKVIQNYATISVNNDPESHDSRDYTMANSFTIGANALFADQGGTLTTNGLTILNNGTLSGAPTVNGDVVNNGTIMVSGGEMILQGSVTSTGTGTLTFDTTLGTLDVPDVLDVHGVAAGETVALQGNDSLILESLMSFHGTLSNTGTNTVTLMGVVANSATLTGGMLNIYNGTTLVDSIAATSTSAAVSVVTAGANSVLTFGVAAPPVAPQIIAGGSAAYAAGAAATVLDAALTVSDPDDLVNSATVAITAGFQPGDTLSIGNLGTLTSSYNAAAGILTLTGADAQPAYRAALDSVAYSNAGDPTGGGTNLNRTITWTITGSSTPASATSSLAVSSPSNPNADILLQNTTGQLELWQSTGTGLSANGFVGPATSPNWFAMTTGGFFPGDTSDVAWQNTDGSVAIWQLNGTTLEGGGVLGVNPGDTWHIRGSGDFYHDGSSDLLWQGDDGSVVLWEMDGTSVPQSGAVADPGSAWLIRGTGDFYNDGHDDILFQNNNGGLAIWDMNGTAIVAGGTIDANPGSSWRVEGTGNFFGDGNTDILFQNDNGDVAIWDMNGTTIVGGGMVASPGATWHVVGTGDFNNDSKTDIVLQNENGSVVTWEMNGTAIAGGGVVANPDPTWNIIGSDTMQFISSGSAEEALAASPIRADEFVFTNAAAGLHTITGFNSIQDIVELPGAEFASFAGVQAATTDTAGGALINLGNGGALLLSGVDSSSLHASNFALA